MDKSQRIPFVRLVVLNWESGELLDRCLTAISQLDWPAGQLDVVVVDNDSTDGSLSVLDANHPHVRLIRNDRNAGFGANNLALSDLGGVDFVGLINPDVVVDRGWLRGLAKALGEDPGLGAACPKILLDRPGAALIQNAGSLIDASGNSRDRGYGELDGPPFVQDCAVDAWCGAAVLLRSAYLDDVGHFEERLFLYYEDTDLSWRGSNRSWRYRYVPSAVCRHRHGASTGLETPEMRRYQTRNRLLVATRNGSWPTVIRAWSRATANLFRPGRAARFRGVKAALAGLPWALRGRAELRRRPGRSVIAGVVDLEACSPDAWEVAGPDPRFELDAERLPVGWIRLRARCVLGDLDGLTPTLRLTGPNRPPQVVRLSRRGSDGIDHVLAVPSDVLSAEIVVVPGSGIVNLSGLEVAGISRARATLSMLRTVVSDLSGVSPHRRVQLFKNVSGRLIRQGPRSVLRGIGRRYSARGRSIVADHGSVPYADWLQAFEPVGAVDKERAVAAIDRLHVRPLVSVVMPVYNTDEAWLRASIDSVRAQWYEHWELCIADDASTAAHVERVLEEYEKLDRRIRVVRRPVNGHISAASNSALELAGGEWIALLDHDDLLLPHALAVMVLTAAGHPDAGLLFSDEDKVDEAGDRYDPHFKPAWNPDLFLSQNYLSHLGMYRHRLVRDVGGFREGYEGSQDYDLALRCVANLAPHQVVHVPFVLYSWRSVPGSTARSVATKSYAEESAIRAIGDHLAGDQTVVDVDLSKAPSTYRVHRRLQDLVPPVEVIVPTRNGAEHLRACLEGVMTGTDYPDLRVQVVDNGSTDELTLEVLREFERRHEGVEVVRDDRPFNFAALNNAAVARSSRPVLCLLNDDIEVLDPGWLTELVAQVSRQEVGVVGAMLRYPDGSVQHGGVVLGAGGVAAHSHAGHATPDLGYFSRLATVHEVGAVTAACLATTRQLWHDVEGMDEELAVNFNDVDFCLRVAELGRRVLWTPHAELLHHESKTRGNLDDEEKLARLRDEASLMLDRWGPTLLEDPAYSPNLTLEGTPFGLSDQPRVRAPWWESLP